jgi:UDP-N-acetylglucosamine--N-acetylmuramyl-(pentapeptide) pyrophosphoryl-undecaprenol N-acetylglucosamine transferase
VIQVSKRRKRIVFTGGGSAGHVMVNLALIPKFQAWGWEVKYIGSKKGIEADLVQTLGGVEYFGISTGKLRRYWDWENFKDPFRVLKGIGEAFQLIREIQPDVIFSKGGFVSVPVVLGGWLQRVPVAIHESDLTPGLANRIALPFASKVFVTFPETLQHLNHRKAVLAGAVIRDELLHGQKVRGLNRCRFTKSKPILLCAGGSLGSHRLNEVIRRNLDRLLEQFQIIHLCGKGQLDESIRHRRYFQIEYAHEELADLLATSDMVISRAGSNAIFEFLALNKPMLLIPLSKKASRGDQILNARSFQAAGYAEVLEEEDMDDEAFLNAVQIVFSRREEMAARMKQDHAALSADQLAEWIVSVSRVKR